MKTFRVEVSRLANFINVLEIKAESIEEAEAIALEQGRTAPLSLSNDQEDPTDFLGDIFEVVINHSTEVK